MKLRDRVGVELEKEFPEINKKTMWGVLFFLFSSKSQKDSEQLWAEALSDPDSELTPEDKEKTLYKVILRLGRRYCQDPTFLEFVRRTMKEVKASLREKRASNNLVDTQVAEEPAAKRLRK